MTHLDSRWICSDLKEQELFTTGNVCRKAFSNPALSSEVLGIDKNLIIKFSNILITINCNNSINPTKFANCCNKT